MSEVVAQAAAQPDYLPSVITGAVAIVAGFGGATLTGWFNRKNAMAGLKAAREDSDTRWKQHTDREHEVWVRDSKKDVYARFIAAAVEVASGKHGSETVRDAASAVSIILGEVQIVGSADFVRLAMDVNEYASAIQELTLVAPKLKAELDATVSRIQVVDDQLNDFTGKLNNLIFSLTILAREDLGISFD